MAEIETMSDTNQNPNGNSWNRLDSPLQGPPEEPVSPSRVRDDGMDLSDAEMQRPGITEWDSLDPDSLCVDSDSIENDGLTAPLDLYPGNVVADWTEVSEDSHRNRVFFGSVSNGEKLDRSVVAESDRRVVTLHEAHVSPTKANKRECFGNSSQRVGKAERTASGNPSPLVQAMITMMMLACTLAAARFLVPSIIEEARYAWRRGQLRADYETSGEGLQDSGLDSLTAAYQMVTQRVAASVVHIEVLKSSTLAGFDADRLSSGSGAASQSSDQGSGVVVDKSGYILTNHHVTAGGTSITVGLSDGRRVKARVIGSDPLTDLSLLKVDAGGLTPIAWGDSDSTEVGTPVWAVGSPFGLDRTVTFGILSGKHRAAKAGTSYQDFMQSDVAVNPGNSGGPLVDGRGRLVGINTAIVGDTYRGVSFSIPSNVAQRVYERLRDAGKFERGWLGVELAQVPEEAVEGGNLLVRGAMVRKLVEPYSPAALAGLAIGDIIVRFEGSEVSDEGALMRMVGNWPAGQTACLDVLRHGRHQAINVEIGTRPLEYNLR
jgi:serine protease Do